MFHEKRKRDRLDDAKGTDAEPEVKAEFARIRGLVRELTNEGAPIILGVEIDGNMNWRIRQEAEMLGCDAKDLHGVLRRMAELRYEQYEWQGFPGLKGQIWKWYVKREDWDAVKDRRRRVHADSDDGGKGRDILTGAGSEDW